MKKTNKGFTLIEILVALFIIMAALGIGYYTFVKVLKLSFYNASVSKSQINTLMGTNLLRYDISMAGYGLTQNIPSDVSYNEATSSLASSHNDAPNAPPWPYKLGTYNDNAYFVVKSTIANLNNASRKWSILYFDGVSWQIQGCTDSVSWPASESDYHFNCSTSSEDQNYYVIILNKKSLYAKSSGLYYFKLSTLPANANIPPSANTYIVYGIDTNTQPRMPFNRVDYYLGNKAMPSFCAQGTYELYRANINQGNGAVNPQPLLDCIVAFEVAIKTNDKWYNRKTFSNLSFSDILNTQEVRVYIVQQSGKRSENYNNASEIALGDKDTGNISSFTPTGDQVHYQWKTVKLSVIPRNLTQ